MLTFWVCLGFARGNHLTVSLTETNSPRLICEVFRSSGLLMHVILYTVWLDWSSLHDCTTFWPAPLSLRFFFFLKSIYINVYLSKCNPSQGMFIILRLSERLFCFYFVVYVFVYFDIVNELSCLIQSEWAGENSLLYVKGIWPSPKPAKTVSHFFFFFFFPLYLL